MASIRTTKRKSLHTPSHFPTTSQPHTMPHSNVHDYLQNVKEVSPTIGEHIHFTRFSERLRRKSSTNVMSCELGNAHTPVKAPERGAIKGRPRLMRNLMKDFVQGIRKAPVVEQEEEEEEEEEDDDNDGWESPYESPEDMNPPLERIREAILRIGDRLVHARDTIFHAGRKKPAPPVRLGGVILLLLLIVCTGLVGMLRPRKQNASVDNTREPTVAAVVDMPSPTPTMTIHPDPDRNDASNVPIAEVEPIETVPSTPPPPAKRVEPELEEQIAEIRLWRQEVLTLLNEKIASLTSKMDALERSIPRVNVAALMSRMEELDDRLQRERGARDVDTTGLREASSGIMADMDALRWRVSSLEEITSTHPLGQDIDERLRQYGEEFQLQIDALRAGSHTETQQPVSLHQEQGMSEEAVKQIVNETLALYSADKTGRVDYALHSAGAVVVTSATTSAYTEPIRLVPEWAFGSLLKRPLGLPPETALDLNMTPGHCFAFAVVGNLAVKLAKEILVTHVSIEHIDRRVAHNNLTSAPKECALYGIHEPSDSHGELLLSFEYKTDEAPLQEFPVDSVGVYSIVRLEVKSNHGHERFTCIYRFRVHGKPSDRSQ